MDVNVTYIGGPTALIEIAGMRLLTDPTFDPAATEYATAHYTLRKTAAPALAADALGHIDAVLLSHDHHADNLDRAGRALLDRVPHILTTQAGAQRLGGRVRGLAPWETVTLVTPGYGELTVVATPARHGPADGDRGPVVGFLLLTDDPAQRAVYVSGDTVWYDGVAEVARRYRCAVALLFSGAARVRAVGPAHLTFTAGEMVAAAHAFGGAAIAPLHFEGWEHFTESRDDIGAAFAAAGMNARLAWLPPGRPRAFSLGPSLVPTRREAVPA